MLSRIALPLMGREADIGFVLEQLIEGASRKRFTAIVS